jgi:taurine dioxygenase
MNESRTNEVNPVQVIPTGGSLGAEITGLDLSHPLDDETAGLVRRALLDHCVIYFRDQQITEPQQVRFTSYFGSPVEHIRDQPDRPVREIFIISNVKENGEPIGALGSGEVSLHSDLSYLTKPGTFTFLYAVEVPNTGGQTQWVNCYAAYESLDADLKERLKGLRAVHRHYIENHNPPELVDHPIVRTHPETGRQALFVGPHLTQSVVGLPETESGQLLETLFEHLSQPRFLWTHSWHVEDLVVWDNRPTLHRRLPFPDTERRIMKRTQIFGDEVPFE